ncbi:MAG: SRPBCC family protein [Actinomycetota bacterium]|nr:SRPBCC family protein [Actinomycetota bacterium]
MTKTIEQSTEVNVPVRTAYNQWTQFEEFPRFMRGVEEVRQIDDTTLHWKAQIAGVEREWTAKITEQTPDQRIAWEAIGETTHAGAVTFHKVDEDTTRVMLQLQIEPDDFAEKAADALHLTDQRTKGDLQRFKEFIETRGEETGAWRGEVPQDPTS